MTAAVCAMVAVAVHGQTFKSHADLVVLDVNVFDGRSDAVPDLPQSVFRVFEDDEPQEITFFSSADVPVTVGLVVDNSGSMIARRAMVVAGGLAFASSSHPEDELFTIHFNEHVRFGLPDGMPFTNRETLLRAALARYPAGGKTALHDAVVSGLAHLERAGYQKRVLIVLTDGEDNASLRSEDEMIERARRSDAIVYTVSNARRDLGAGGNPRVLRTLADITGGTAYVPRSDEAVVRAFDQIAGNIRRGYRIGYVPTNTTHDGGFRRVTVVVRVPGRGDLEVRSRHGYVSDSHD
ncbi:MAG: VWA domain-containing protein [Acidobacteria bacterium]|nr:VWA domain-containing protein [Acidobacteriota bacterium]